MADAPAGLSLRLAAEYRDARSWSACWPVGVARSDRNSFSLSWRVFLVIIDHPFIEEEGAVLETNYEAVAKCLGPWTKSG
jgi:hypothetical protein